jgi:tetratricopeptide (TPR) repeat protein
MQQRRNQYVDALATLARARELAPDSDAVQRAQADAAMNWIRHAHVEPGKSTFGEAIKPALSVVDAALPSATGQRRADLLAHSGWATFLLWRDGDRQLDPTDWYQQALAIDPTNPYANAMLAHWILFRGDDVARAAALFATALRSGRAVEDVRTLQWAAYGNSSTPAAGVERVRLADAMRRAGEKLDERQASSLRATYYFAMPNSHQKERQALLEAVAPDDQIATLKWAFGDDTDPSRQLMIRYYAAQLDAAAGRVDKAVADLRALQRDIGDNPGSLLTAVQQALERLAPGATRKR